MTDCVYSVRFYLPNVLLEIEFVHLNAEMQRRSKHERIMTGIIDS